MLSDLGIVVIIIGGLYVYFSDENMECRRLERMFDKKPEPWKMPKLPTAVEIGRALGRLVRRIKCI